jgi:hypothetical protein
LTLSFFVQAVAGFDHVNALTTHLEAVPAVIQTHLWFWQGSMAQSGSANHSFTDIVQSTFVTPHARDVSKLTNSLYSSFGVEYV